MGKEFAGGGPVSFLRDSRGADFVGTRTRSDSAVVAFNGDAKPKYRSGESEGAMQDDGRKLPSREPSVEIFGEEARPPPMSDCCLRVPLRACECALALTHTYACTHVHKHARTHVHMRARGHMAALLPRVFSSGTQTKIRGGKVQEDVLHAPRGCT